uniref:Non-specific lipid-transfer protein n=1 Tax=Solanum chacoense TaxID=4108 RepID=Q1PCI0_SOLCH|nr:lipid-transfer protein precursor [Solanum chacoense]
MEIVSKIACFVLLCMVVVAPHAEAALTCGQVTSSLFSCLPYLRNTGPLGDCCSGVKKLKGQAQTTADRQTACNCLKSTAGSIKGLNFGKAASLPSTCSVNIPYEISPSTDCSKVQ